MNCLEQPIVFRCGAESLLGILSRSQSKKNIGVLIVVGGPQYRVGSHRQFVLLARYLADSGISVFRFDYRGMGDSTGDLRVFDEVNDDIAAAIYAFQNACPEIERMVLWGLCDAASASLIYWNATRDKRLAGMVLLNPWVRSELSLAKTHIRHYYWKRLLQAEFWKKILTFKLGLGRSIEGLVRTLLRAYVNVGARDSLETYQYKMLQTLKNFPGSILLILSGDDYTAKEFLEVCQADAQTMHALSGANIERVDLAGADHTFSSPKQQQAVEGITLSWLEKLLVR